MARGPLAGASDKIFHADNLNGTTNAVDMFNGKFDYNDKIFISVSAPASKYINVTDDGGTCLFYIIEEAA